MCRYRLDVWAKQKKLVLQYHERGGSSDGGSAARGGGDGSLRPTQFAICPAAEDYVVDMWWECQLLVLGGAAAKVVGGVGWPAWSAPASRMLTALHR